MFSITSRGWAYGSLVLGFGTVLYWLLWFAGFPVANHGALAVMTIAFAVAFIGAVLTHRREQGELTVWYLPHGRDRVETMYYYEWRRIRWADYRQAPGWILIEDKEQKLTSHRRFRVKKVDGRRFGHWQFFPYQEGYQLQDEHNISPRVGLQSDMFQTVNAALQIMEHYCDHTHHTLHKVANLVADRLTELKGSIKSPALGKLRKEVVTAARQVHVWVN